ncbi:hypothetical protein XpopCFBP1817_13835 [Xanthomonas populi]|uniref:Alcohol dehydrogenase-like N-terminal domain-containing protein n=1 Tax=Xanthomonas populi TaxID=53414 RepID=A0A2S7EM73_9XANT|nr:hypothetical protein XpopCFBP1817_13835 [Xanthomonas populi]
MRCNDVAIKVVFCGVCHSDLHPVNQWASEYPLVPGHEIVGEVVELGADVAGFTLGQHVMIGTIVDSCRQCPPCPAPAPAALPTPRRCWRSANNTPSSPPAS